MQAPHRYPAGKTLFPQMREGGFLYVDKTRYIWDMVSSGGSYWFLSRPRRFGKTLLVSTMEAYFQGRCDLFEGLYIGSREKEWRRYPVLRFDLSAVKATDMQGLRETLGFVLERYERAYGLDSAETSFSARVSRLIETAHDQTGEQVVILVDEYDSPLLPVLGNPQTLQDFRQAMRDFYAPLKAEEGLLRFVFLTGITKFSQLSIFSELNNLNNISMVPNYAGICGITAEELGGYMAPDVEWLADQLGMPYDKTMAALGDKYDGYHFAKRSPDVYNPYSLVLALQNLDLGNWWFGSGTPTVLVDALERFDFDIPSLEGFQAPEADFDAPTEQMTSPVPLLYQAGYLTIKGYSPDLDLYTLGVPNAEVSEGLYRALLPSYVTPNGMQSTSFIIAFAKALRADDIDSGLRDLRSFLAGIPYDLAAKDEKAFQAQLFILLKAVGAYVSSEVRTATGRIDVTLETRTTLFVLELKYSGSARAALDQIDSKGYLIPYAHSGRRLVKVGVNYSPSERTIEEGWLVEEG